MYQEKLTWVAVMEDGTIFPQHQEIEKSSEDIPRDKLRRFCLVDDVNMPVFVKELQPGWQFFYRRRTAITQSKNISSVIHIVGWKIPFGDAWLTQIAYIYEEDCTVYVSDMASNQPQPIMHKTFLWQHPISPVAADELVIT